MIALGLTLYGVITFGVAIAGFIGWSMYKGLFQDDAEKSARMARRCYLWPLMLVGKVKEMLEDSK